jgi:hypothetical protein
MISFSLDGDLCDDMMAVPCFWINVVAVTVTKQETIFP